jgi:hypothetical protein
MRVAYAYPFATKLPFRYAATTLRHLSLPQQESTQCGFGTPATHNAATSLDHQSSSGSMHTNLDRKRLSEILTAE